MKKWRLSCFSRQNVKRQYQINGRAKKVVMSPKKPDRLSVPARSCQNLSGLYHYLFSTTKINK
jgi:hypothetical protein